MRGIHGLQPVVVVVKKTLENRFADTQFELKPFYPSSAHLLGPVSSFPRLVNMMKSEPSPDLIVFDTRFFPC